ncbi:unnamed protein product [Dibothriocephalus latus]|uniref:BTB domain-containing protein n=1 Tax=Dibothriocephalus latus TaxID=60516 RepID=A0A3P7Q1G0_DIBLA|nr:unnamed protein product [Dibothriocephalus latus]
MTNEETQMFEDEPALIRCLPELNSLRMTSKLTDLTIELQDFVKLYAHKVVFASRVPSLCNTLCETLTKNQAVVLKWPTISSEVATTLMDYIYTGRLEVREANAAGLIALSQQLILPQVEIWANNWDLAQVLKSDALRNVCLQHIKATFEVSVASSVFPQLPPDAVLSLLRADDLQVENEESLLNAIGRWIRPFGNVDEKRIVHAAAMMQELRWNQVDADFRYRLHDDYEGFWNKDVECLRLLSLINKWIDSPTSRGSRPCPFNERRRERLVDSERRQNPLANICLLSTTETEGQCLLTRYDAETKTSQQLTHVTAGLDAAFVVVEDCIFAIGGYQQHSNYTNFDKFDTKARRWNELVPLPECRKKPTAVAVVVGQETVIFVCGGSNSSDRELGTCMIYSPLEDK